MLPYFKKDPQSNYAQALTELSLFITEIEQYIERDKSLASQECFNKLKNFKKAYENLFKATGDDQKKIELNQSFNQIIRNFYEYIPLELFEQKGNIFNALVTKKAIVNFIEMAHQDMVQMVDTHKVQDTSPQISQAAIQKLKDYLLEEVDRSVDLLELKEIKGDLESFVTSHYLHQAQVQDIFDAINLKASQLSITDFAQRVGNFNPQKYETPVQVQAALKELISHLKDIPIADNLSEYDKDQYNHAFENLFFHIENELNTINTSVRDFIRNGNQGNLDELSKIEELRESISQSSNELLKINNQILTGSDLLQIRVNKLKANLNLIKQHYQQKKIC
jgi:hypothetical protein